MIVRRIRLFLVQAWLRAAFFFMSPLSVRRQIASSLAFCMTLSLAAFLFVNPVTTPKASADSTSVGLSGFSGSNVHYNGSSLTLSSSGGGNEVQTITLTNRGSAASVTVPATGLGSGGSIGIAPGASASTVRSALASMASIGSTSNVSVSGGTSADIVVSGAGFADYNGTYSYTGDDGNGNAQYKLDNSHFLYNLNGSNFCYWSLGSSIGAFPVYTATSAGPVTGAMTYTNGGNGSPPAPSLGFSGGSGSYVVSGAGFSDANGTYADQGVNTQGADGPITGDHHYYKNANGLYLYYVDPSYGTGWGISSLLGSFPPSYYHNWTSDILNPWTSNTGAYDPAPTVTPGDYVISGAGNSALNGTYVDNGVGMDGVHHNYILNGTYYLWYFQPSDIWGLSDTDNYLFDHAYYENNATDPTTPTWVLGPLGSGSAPGANYGNNYSGTYTVTFQGALASTDISQMTTSSTGWSGGTTTNGAAGTYAASGNGTVSVSPQPGTKAHWTSVTPSTTVPANTSLTLTYSTDNSTFVSDITTLSPSDTLYVKAALATSDTSATSSLDSLSVGYTLLSVSGLSPSGGQSYLIGAGTGAVSNVPLSWSASDTYGTDHVRVSYSTNSGSAWTDIPGPSSTNETQVLTASSAQSTASVTVPATSLGSGGTVSINPADSAASVASTLASVAAIGSTSNVDVTGSTTAGGTNYIVAGAGSAGYNGTYVDQGLDVNSNHYYKLDNSHYLFHSYVSSAWYLAPSIITDNSAPDYDLSTITGTYSPVSASSPGPVVSATGTSNGSYTIAFKGALAATPITLMTVSGSGWSFSRTHSGGGVNEKQTLAASGAGGGSFTIPATSLGSGGTLTISGGDSAATVRSNLAAIAAVGSTNNVLVSGGTSADAGGSYVVAGAGSSSYNGTYLDMGDDGHGNGQHYFSKNGGSGPFIYAASGGHVWQIADSLATGVYDGQYDNGYDPTLLPVPTSGNTWSPDNGSFPGPTVTYQSTYSGSYTIEFQGALANTDVASITTASSGWTATTDQEGQSTLYYGPSATSATWTPADGTNTTQAKVRVQYEDATNTVLASATSGDFTVVTNAAPGASPSTPASAASLTAGSISFTAAITDADAGDTVTADWRLCSDSGCSTVVDSVTGQAVTLTAGAGTFSSSRSVSTGSYWWEVRANDSYGATSGWSTARTLTVVPGNNAPTVGTLGGADKVDGSHIATVQPSLTFTTADADSGDTVQYRVQVSTHSDFSSPVVDYSSALATPGALSFTVGQAAGAGSYTTGSSGQSLADASYYWRVMATDNNSASSSWAAANGGAIAFTVDTTNPTVSSVSLSSDNGGSSSIAKAGDTVTLTFDRSEAFASNPTVTLGTKAMTFSSLSGSTYTYTRLLDGSETESVSSPVAISFTDLAGNPGSGSGSFHLDFTAPAAPSVTTPAAAAFTSASSSTVAGTAEADSLVTIKRGATTVGSQQLSGGATSYSISATLVSGANNLTVTAADLAGNVSSGTSAPTITLDTTAPTFSSLSASSNNARSSSLAKSGDIVTLTFDTSETLAANPAVTLGTKAMTYSSLSGSTYTYTRVLDGSETESVSSPISISGSDLAGNAGSGSTSFNLDFTAPAAPVVSLPASAVHTQAGTYAISGTAPADSLVVIKSGSTAVGSQQLTGGATAYSVTVSVTYNAANSFTAYAEDAAGNLSAGSAVPTITNDTVAPALPVVSSPVSTVYTSASSYAIAGSSEANSLVSLLQGGNPAGSQQLVSGATAYSITATLTANSANVFTVKAADAAGNESGTVTVATIVQDNLAPATPSLTSPADGSTGNSRTPTLVGSAYSDTLSPQGSARWEVASDGGFASVIRDSGIDASHLSSYVVSSLADGTYWARVAYIDAAGNVSSWSAPAQFAIDATAPAVSGLTASSTNPNPATATTGDTVTVSFSVSDAPASNPIVTLGTKAMTLVSHVGPSYQYSRTLDGSETSGSIVVSLADAVGNVGGTTGSITFYAPPAPTPTPAPTATPSPSSIASPSPAPTATPSPSPTITASPTAAPTATATATATVSPTATPTSAPNSLSISQASASVGPASVTVSFHLDSATAPANVPVTVYASTSPTSKGTAIATVSASTLGSVIQKDPSSGVRYYYSFDVPQADGSVRTFLNVAQATVPTTQYKIGVYLESVYAMPGESRQLKANVIDTSGNPVAAQLTWKLTKTAGNTAISPDGILKAGSIEGTWANAIQVTASLGSEKGLYTVNLTVDSNTVLSSLSVTPGSITLKTNTLQQFGFYALNQNGSRIDPTKFGYVATWNANGGTVNKSGQYRSGLAEGAWDDAVTLTFTKGSQSISASARVTVSNQHLVTKYANMTGPQRILDANPVHYATYAFDQFGNAIYLAHQILYSTSDTDAGTFDPAGNFHPNLQGCYDWILRADHILTDTVNSDASMSFSKSAAINVPYSAAEIASKDKAYQIAWAPGFSYTMKSGASQPLYARIYDGWGTTRADTAASFSIHDATGTFSIDPATGNLVASATAKPGFYSLALWINLSDRTTGAHISGPYKYTLSILTDAQVLTRVTTAGGVGRPYSTTNTGIGRYDQYGMAYSAPVAVSFGVPAGFSIYPSGLIETGAAGTYKNAIQATTVQRDGTVVSSATADQGTLAIGTTGYVPTWMSLCPTLAVPGPVVNRPPMPPAGTTDPAPVPGSTDTTLSDVPVDTGSGVIPVEDPDLPFQVISPEDQILPDSPLAFLVSQHPGEFISTDQVGKQAALLHPDRPAGFLNPPRTVAETVHTGADLTGVISALIGGGVAMATAVSGLVAQTGSAGRAIQLYLIGLFPRRRRRWGSATDSATGLPIVGATIVMTDIAGKEVDRCVSDRYGEFFLLPPTAGTYRVSLVAAGYQARGAVTVDIPNPDQPPTSIQVMATAGAELVRQRQLKAVGLGRLSRLIDALRLPSFVLGTALAVYSALLFADALSYGICGFYALLWTLGAYHALTGGRTWGGVYDGNDHAALLNAVVTFYQVAKNGTSLTPARAVNTDTRGRYRTRLSAGDYRVHAEHRGYVFNDSSLISATPRKPVTEDIRLVPEEAFTG